MRLSLPALRSAATGALLLGCGLLAAFARAPEPVHHIPLESVGFQPLSKQFLLAGSSMLTLHYVDDTHLLVTYGVHRLLKRLPECPPEDSDRAIEAVLVDLPSGHVSARAEWRAHDHSQYLWSLGNGRFLRRERNRLLTFAPLASRDRKEAFADHLLISAAHPIALLALSPDGSLLRVETQEPPRAQRRSGTIDLLANAASESADPTQIPPVEIDFYRIQPPSAAEPARVSISHAGYFLAKNLLDIPADSSGYIETLDQGRQHWAFNFNAYSGKVEELSPFDSSCRPNPVLVSRSEFVSFGCKTGKQRMLFGGFNLRGEEMWEQNFFEPYVAPSFAVAPESGRFAISRILVSGLLAEASAFAPDLVTGQSVTVYQMESGRQLFTIDPSPIERAGQNFTLSPDGLSLAVIRGESIEVYRLPPLTGKDRDGLRLARSLAPPPENGPVRLTRMTEDRSAGAMTRAEPAPGPGNTAQPLGQSQPASAAVGSAPEAAETKVGTPSPGGAQAPRSEPVATPTASAVAPPAGTAPTVEGDVPARRAPTLYNAPGEQPPTRPSR